MVENRIFIYFGKGSSNPYTFNIKENQIESPCKYVVLPHSIMDLEIPISSKFIRKLSGPFLMFFPDGITLFGSMLRVFPFLLESRFRYLKETHDSVS